MIDYDNMSDWEVNYKAFLLGVRKGLFEFEDIMTKPLPDRDAVQYGDGCNWYSWDGCNNASDAWKIIVENNINVHTSMGQCFIQGKVSHSCDNLLRSVLIVFLMANEE